MHQDAISTTFAQTVALLTSVLHLSFISKASKQILPSLQLG
jgi:hypothetical protein